MVLPLATEPIVFSQHFDVESVPDLTGGVILGLVQEYGNSNFRRNRLYRGKTYINGGCLGAPSSYGTLVIPSEEFPYFAPDETYASILVTSHKWRIGGTERGLPNDDDDYDRAVEAVTTLAQRIITAITAGGPLPTYTEPQP